MREVRISPERRPLPHGKYVGVNYSEHQYCCELAELIKVRLEYNGFKASICDPNDTMETRVSKANRDKVDLYMPLHTNGSANGTATGTEVLYFNHPASIKAAKLMYENLTKLYPSKRGVKDYSHFYENAYTNMVSVYPEIAFHDNPKDVEFLLGKKLEIADAITKSICQYFGMEYKELIVENEPVEEICPNCERLLKFVQDLGKLVEEVERDCLSK